MVVVVFTLITSNCGGLRRQARYRKGRRSIILFHGIQTLRLISLRFGTCQVTSNGIETKKRAPHFCCTSIQIIIIAQSMMGGTGLGRRRRGRHRLLLLLQSEFIDRSIYGDRDLHAHIFLQTLLLPRIALCA